MRILALEFSTLQGSVAIIQAAARAAAMGRVEVIDLGGQTKRALPMIEEALGRASLERHQLDCIAVGLGPGSYTGIRATIALAQGWQLANEIKLLGISSVECVARQAWEEGIRGRICILVDAQRGEFYLATYELDSGRFRELDPLRLAGVEDARAREKAGDLLVGPEVTKWFPSGRVVFPRAEGLGQLALTRTDFIAGERLEPIYLREVSFVKAPPPRKLR